MKLSEYKKISETYTGKASDIIRQLILGGVAIIWLFKVSDNGKESLDKFLVFPLLTLSLALVADLLQYVVGGRIWNKFFIEEEKKAVQNHKTDSKSPLDPEIKAPRKLNKPIYFFYWTKISLMIASYIFIVVYLIGELNIK
jgi:hypothetical protein